MGWSRPDCAQKANFDAPLSQWKHPWYQSFDKADDCEAEAERISKDTVCDCVGTNDPRLKDR